LKKEFNFKNAKKVGNKFKNKEIKISVTSRLDPKIVEWLRKESDKRGIPYQTLMNSILMEAMNKMDRIAEIRRIVKEELAKAI
jgi:uncharacterized protein (DUF4415 family)